MMDPVKQAGEALFVLSDDRFGRHGGVLFPVDIRRRISGLRLVLLWRANWPAAAPMRQKRDLHSSNIS